MAKARKKTTEAPDKNDADFKLGFRDEWIKTTLGRRGVTYIIPEANLTATTSRAQFNAGAEAARASLIHVDRERFTVTYDGRIGTIGNTDSFALLACLVDQVHQSVNHEALLHALGDKSVIIKFKIRDLKAVLHRVRFGDLADAIESGDGFYKLSPKSHP